MQGSTEINIAEQNVGQKFSLKEMNEKRNYFIKEIKQNELISKKLKKKKNNS